MIPLQTLKKWNFNFNIDHGDAARGKRKGDDKSQKYILHQALPARWHDPEKWVVLRVR